MSKRPSKPWFREESSLICHISLINYVSHLLKISIALETWAGALAGVIDAGIKAEASVSGFSCQDSVSNVCEAIWLANPC